MPAALGGWDLDLLVVADQAVILAVHLHLQAGLGDEVFQREVGEIRVVIDRACPLALDLERVLAGLDGVAEQDRLVS